MRTHRVLVCCSLITAIVVFVPHSSATTKGRHLEKGLAAIDELARRGISQLKEKEGAERFSQEPIERYQWPLAAGILLIATTVLLNERRRKREGGRFSIEKSMALVQMK